MFWSSSILATQITAIILCPLFIAFREFAISKYPSEKRQFWLPECNYEISWDKHAWKGLFLNFFFKIIWLSGIAWDFAFETIYTNKTIACFIRQSAYKRLFINVCFRAAFELCRHEWLELARWITKKEMLHIPGFLKFFFLHQVLQVEETTVKEMDNWKATPWDNVLLKIFYGAPISRWLADGSDRSNFSILRLLYVISLQQFLRWKFRIMFTE